MEHDIQLIEYIQYKIMDRLHMARENGHKNGLFTFFYRVLAILDLLLNKYCWLQQYVNQIWVIRTDPAILLSLRHTLIGTARI